MSNYRTDSQIKWEIVESVYTRGLEEPEGAKINDVRKDVGLNSNAIKKKIGELEKVGAVVTEDHRVRLSEKGIDMMKKFSGLMGMIGNGVEKTYDIGMDYAKNAQDPMIQKYRERISQNYVFGRDQINWPRIVYEVMVERTLRNGKITSMRDIGAIKEDAIRKAEYECGSAFKNGNGKKGYSRKIGYVYSNIVGIGLLFLNSN